MTALYIGIMSGTSADGIDAVLISGNPEYQLLATYTESLEATMREEIHALCIPGDNEIDRLGHLDIALAKKFAACIKNLLTHANISPGAVTAIGSHGQTIRHRPAGTNGVNCFGNNPFTLQIVDPNTIAELTGITTIADFRRRDIAAKGQGAPLVPAFHQAFFADSNRLRAIVNIGGMANITWLAPDQTTLGFDTGPGNVLLNAWTQRHLNIPYDKDGIWGASGEIDGGLLRQLLKHPFLQIRPPKSTGREDFHLQWLDAQLTDYPQLAANDVQATLVAFTAATIANEISALRGSNTRELDVIICGGGAYNPALLTAIQTELPDASVFTTTALGIAPEWVEAVAFAWLAEQTLQRKPGNLKAVTGASREVILGGIYYA